MSSSPNQTIICQEVFDENSHPSEEEVLDYAVKIGIDPKSEPHLLPIARDGLMHALPSEWKPCFDSSLQRWYYFNTNSGNSQWEHPLDPVYKEIVKRGRSEGYSSAGDDDSKTTAKEDLKSFEEVSDMLSSRSNDNLRSSSIQHTQDTEKAKGLFVSSQPLLARRKQLQRCGSESLKPTPLQTAKVINATLRETNFKEFNDSNEWPGSSLSVSGGLNIMKDYKSRSVSNTPETAKQAMQPLRRAHTLDPISDTVKVALKREDTVPIKGILRDTSFNSLPPRSLARLDPMPGEYGSGISEAEDEKKRSVRFADFEFKAMDIKFQISDSEESIYGVDDGDEGSGSTGSPIEEHISEDNTAVTKTKKNPPSEGITQVKATPIRNITIQKSSVPDASNEKKRTIDNDENKNVGKPLFKSPFSGNTLVNQPFFPKSISDVDSTSSSNSDNDSNVAAEVRSKEKLQIVVKDNISDVIADNKLVTGVEKKVTDDRDISAIAESAKSSPWMKSPSNEQLEEISSVGNKCVKRINVEMGRKISPSSKSDTPQESSVSSQKKMESEQQPRKPNNIRRSISLLEYDIPLNEMEELAKKKASEKLVVFQEKLTKDIQEKITALKQQQNQSISEAKETIKKEETVAILKLRQEMEKKLKDYRDSLEEEFKIQDEILRKDHEKVMHNLIKELELKNEQQISSTKAKYATELKEHCEAEEERYANEKSKLRTETDQRIQKSAAILKEQINEIQMKEESEISEVKQKSDRVIDDLKKKYEANIDDLEEKYKKEIKRIEEGHSAALKAIRIDKEAELRRVETEWDDKITASSLQHKAMLESAILDHERNITTLRQQFQKDEDELKRKHAEQIEAWNIRVKRVTDKESIDIAQMNRDFEKMRCEKRLLEDKYRSLKDKYVQLKSDMRVAVERKLQSRARRRREEIVTQHSERNESKAADDIKSPQESILRNGKLHNNNNLESDNQTEKIFSGESTRSPMPRHLAVHMLREPMQENMTDNDPSSTDDQYNSLSSTHATESETKIGFGAGKEGKSRSKKQSRLKIGKLACQKDVSGNILDNVKSQLQELDEIEERIPSTAHKDTYVRYPFLGPGIGTSAEVDFYRHRVLVEQEAVRAARECLLQQKRELEMRQNLLKSGTNFSTLYQQQQQEKDLTEMEVSIHRTRALLGEKMIRLRLLGQTLDRLVHEPPSPSNTAITNSVLLPGDESGNYTTEGGTFNVLQNLENINSEIRDIWTQLKTKQDPVSPPIVTFKDQSSVRNNDEGLMCPARVRSTKEREAIESRLEELRQWLDKPKQSLNPTWTQLTL